MHGLIGNWAFDCATASSSENAYTVIEAPADSAPTERLTMGDYERVAVISGVTELESGKLQWTQNDGAKQHLIVKSIEGGRMRTWMSTRSDGEVLIRNGRFKSGDEVKWFYRCDAGN